MAALLLAGAAPAKLDRDAAAWWATTAQLSNDAMEGRDTGSSAYLRAANIVASKFAAAGLKPAGENGTWFQRVPMHELAVARAAFRVGNRPLVFLHDLTISPTEGMPRRIDAPLAYGGYCGAASLNDVHGKVVICHGTHRAGLPSAAQREAAVRAAGAAGMLTIADPGFTVEPPRWPYAYARTVTLASDPRKIDPFVRMTLNADSLGKLLAGSGRNAAALIAAGSAGRPLPSFAVPMHLRADLTIRERDIASPNVIAFLPGSDPKLANQAIVLSAHLDGYGYGEPVNGDRIYNGTLDDAAYVALLIRLAERRHGQPFRRPILFAAGDRRGERAARLALVRPAHRPSPVPHRRRHQPRPVAPDLSARAADGACARRHDPRRRRPSRCAVSASQVQHDPEPERNLLRRSDQWPFMQAGIPATAFVFGYRPGSRSEQIYRQWYRTGYHKPQDDLNQPMDWKAAADFNRFFYALVERVANQPTSCPRGTREAL